MPTRTFVTLTTAILISVGTTCGHGHAALLDDVRFKTDDTKQRDLIHVPRAAEAPSIDAVLADAVWQNAWRTTKIGWGSSGQAANETELLLAYDADKLYLAARCHVAEPTALKTKYPAGEENAGAWGDDCIDFKLSADNQRTSCQFIVSAAGAYYDARDSDVDYNPVWERAARIGEKEYIIELALPLKSVGVSEFRPGLSILFNLGRADRTTRELSSLAEPYGDLAAAPLLVLGTEEERQSFLASGAFLREVDIRVLLDRDRYPTFQQLATGRIYLHSAQAGTKLAGKPAVLLSIQRDGKVVAAERIEPVLSPVIDFDLPVANLKPGDYELVLRVADGDEVLESTARRGFVVHRARPQSSGRIPVSLPPAPARLQSFPITFGVPFPWGALGSPDNVQLLDENGRELPIQVEVAGRWSRQGSIRWLRLDCLPEVRTTARNLTLVYGPGVTRRAAATPLSITETEEHVSVETGPLRFLVPKNKTPGISQLWLDQDGDGAFGANELMMRPHDEAGPYLVDEAGVVYQGVADESAEVQVESSGPLKACVRVSGWHVAASGEKLGKFALRYYAYAGLPYVRVYHTFTVTAGSNKDTVGAPEGTPGTEEVRYRDIAYAIPFSSTYYVLGTPKIHSGWVRGKDDSAYLLQRDDLFCKLVQNGRFKDECEKAEGWMSVGTTRSMMTVAVKDFWQQFPKELEIRNDRAIVHFWPAHNEAPIRTGANLSIENVYQQWFAHEGLLDFKIPEEALAYVKQDSERYNWPSAKIINAIGLAKTHEMLLYFHAQDWEKARARSVSRTFQANLTATCAPEWTCNSNVFGNMLAHSPRQFPQIEQAIDENIDCIFRHREMDRDYGMFNFGDSHHNWFWQERRWSLHRIWRNTHHGWTRWPWLMYARTGRKELFDWGDRNARHVADVDHCHYAAEPFVDLPYPRGKLVGGICDYKGFVHWASGARLGYNSAADAMIHHYYFTGDERSRTAALEHGRALIDNRRALPHREGSGRLTSACALYFLTWDNDYLDLIERTVDRLLGTQRDDGSFPQWEDFAPFLQRYVDLTGSRRGMEAMARWADWICEQRQPCSLYHSKLSILAHAYLYTGDEKYLRTAAYRVHASVDNQYLGEDPRYRGMFIVGHSNLDQSYFMQWIGYYLSAIAKHGKEPEPERPDRTWIRTVDRVALGETSQTAWKTRYESVPEQAYVWQARLRQRRKEALDLHLELRAYNDQKYMAELHAHGADQPTRVFALVPKHETAGSVDIHRDADTAADYDLRIYSDKNFSVKVPLSYGQRGLQEVYPLFGTGTVVGDGLRCWFNLPTGAESFSLGYKGRAWPLRAELFAPDGERVGVDTWISSNDPYVAVRWLDGSAAKGREGWSFSTTGYGPGGLLEFRAEPAAAQRPFFFSLDRDKLFSPKQ